ncbi:MAG TPA: immunoglobulin domain-containing protein [Verrucomicrobiae bacterium]|nr:immunoglobulin domain-containing protein [Verrucomicrobiae bacterium]
MKKSFAALFTVLLAFGAQAQTTAPSLPPGKLAIFKAGDNTGIYNISVAKSQPCFVQVFDTDATNQTAPLLSVPLPTNGANGIFINAHAGSEGGGISRSENREFLALEGYTGNLPAPTAAKPSADPTVTRGFGTLDAFGNEQVLYSDIANWFGLPLGVTQNNPTGIATSDGTNFWGTGNVAGTSSEATGTLFFNGSFPDYGGMPVELQNFIQAAAQARIIGGTLYIVVPGAGVYNFLDPFNNDTVVPLPFDPNVPNPVEHIVLTNLFINWGSTFKNIANFDMNPQGTIAYGADQTFGIVKFVNTNGVWTQAPYYFSSTNIGTVKQKAANQGCFGICVDFSTTNPVIYATTMENGTTPAANSQGNANQNRLIRIVDMGVNPLTNLVADTLATATTTNENFRGIDFTPDLRPLITSAPSGYSTTNGGTASFAVADDSVFAVGYQWLQNGMNLLGQTNATLTLNNLDTSFNDFTYQCVVTNQYGSVTSAPPAVLVVTEFPVAPVIGNTPTSVAGFIGSSTTFGTIAPTGTQPFSFQWYFGTTPLVDDGVKYSGSTTGSLSISNLSTMDIGNYYLVATNVAGVASNLVDMLTVQFHKASITAGQPASVTTFVGLTTSLTATQGGGSAPLTNQWFKGSTALTDGNEFMGTATGTLTISPVSTNDAGSYKLVISNGGGSVTSSVATVTVLIPPPLSSVAYSNQVYVQNFDSLPDPGTNSVNSFNNPQDPGSINGISYSLANPFDFSFPVINSSFVGGLGLSNTMPGWYGAADTTFPGVDGITRFGAQDGDQTTGGVLDFGPNDGPDITGTNRALGLLSTGTTGATTYALKLINTSGKTLNYINLSFLGELWHNGTGHRLMSFGYTIDNTATNFVLTAQSISNSTLVPGLSFSFQTNIVVVATDGTQAANQIAIATNNLALATAWQPNAALWLIWGLDFYGSGSGNGYAIDNLSFSASATAGVVISKPSLGNVAFSAATGLSFSFTNAPGLGFTVYGTTSLAAPIVWTPLGPPTEAASGSFSTYRFTDASATNGVKRFYKVTSP